MCVVEEKRAQLSVAPTEKWLESHRSLPSVRQTIVTPKYFSHPVVG